MFRHPVTIALLALFLMTGCFGTAEAKTLRFAGHDFIVRGAGKGGPGPNHWDPANALMCLFVVVEREELLEALIKSEAIIFRVKIDVVLLHCPPKPFDEDVVRSSAFSIHTDVDLFFVHILRPKRTGELATLIGVDDLRLAVATHSGL